MLIFRQIHVYTYLYKPCHFTGISTISYVHVQIHDSLVQTRLQ